MNGKRLKIAKLSLAALLLLMLTMIFSSLTVLAEGNVEWNSNTRNEEIKAPQGSDVGTADWGSQTYIAPDDSAAQLGGSNNPDTDKNDAANMAVLAAIAGVLGISVAVGAAKLKKEVTSIIPEGNGLWIAAPDREKVLAYR